MFRFAPYVIKSLYRHRARTLLTVSGAAVALFVFCFVGSVQQGLHRLTEDRDAQRTLIVFQENRFCPTSSRLPQDYADRIRKIVVGSGPAGAAPRWQRFQRDVVADFQRAFGEPPGALIGAAFMTDADNTGSRAEACYGSLVFRDAAQRSLPGSLQF